MILRFARRLAAAFATAFLFATSASAVVTSTDFTDMWWNAGEDGWGVNVIQQGDIVFATFFVYGPNSQPIWYVASSMTPQTSTPGSYTFKGGLHRTNGPWFGGPFTPAVTNQQVGEATITFSSQNSATLTYNVDTTNVTKTITRYTFRNNTPAGRYYPGGLTAARSACTGGLANGNVYFAGFIQATLSGSSARFLLDFNDSSGARLLCTFDGTWVQEGRLASVTNGTWSCVNTAGGGPVNSGTFALSRVDVQVEGFTSQFVGGDNFCQYSGRFGGVRDVVP